MTKILITSDLHYDIARSRASAEHLARRVREMQGDVLILAGDTAGADVQWLTKALELFRNFDGIKALVPGNHCLWCSPDETHPAASLKRYEQTIPQAAADCGFITLDHDPLVLGDVCVVGSVGWYDYSMRDAGLAIPVEFYQRKISPGAAKYFGQCKDLFERHGDEITPRQLAIGARWMDGRRVKLGITDEEFVVMLVEKLERQIIEQSASAKQIVAVMHHLPFTELVPAERPDRFAFAAAYLGSEKFGEMLKRHEKVSHVYCGHSHWQGQHKAGRLQAINIGSTYVHKQLEVLEV